MNYQKYDNMEATLKFDLPDDQDNFEAASKAMSWALLVWDLDQFLRDKLKYKSDQFKSAEEELEGIRNHIHHLMEEEGLTFPS